MDKKLKVSPGQPKIGFAFDNYMLYHKNSEDHVERPTRLMTIYMNFEELDLLKRFVKI
jgi:hypothetical protein